MSNLVFVYGTLKSGYGNHHYMKRAGGEFLGESSVQDLKIYNYCSHFPVVAEGEGGRVYGEVYKVKDMGPLDALEGYPRFYDRKVFQTSYGPAWVYLMPSKQLEGVSEIKSGKWPE